MGCYLCGNAQLDVLTTELRHGPGIVLHCERCDLGMLDAPEMDLEKFYRDEYRRLHGPVIGQTASYEEIFAAYVEHQRSRVDMLRPHLGTSTRLLEIGCSTGHFLYALRGLVGEAIGVDYDAGAAAFAHDATGWRTYGQQLETTDLAPGSFDVVCAFQTLEHVPDPLSFVGSLARYVKPGGLIAVEVPSLHDPLLAVYDIPGYTSFYFHSAHLFYFSPRSLTLLMEQVGFVGEVRYTQDFNILNHVSWALTGRPQASSAPGLGRPRLPLREVAPELRRDLDGLLDRLDDEYKALLVTHGMTANITFLGRPTA